MYLATPPRFELSSLAEGSSFPSFANRGFPTEPEIQIDHHSKDIRLIDDANRPFAYSGMRIRWNGVPDLPKFGFFRLLQAPSAERNLEQFFFLFSLHKRQLVMI